MECWKAATSGKVDARIIISLRWRIIIYAPPYHGCLARNSSTPSL
jgi:hypothetical protein